MEEEKLVESWKAVMAALAKKDIISYYIIKSLRVVASKEIETACTNGKQLLINSEWFSKLPMKQRLAVLVHEVKHIVNKHPIRAEAYLRSGEDIRQMNIAMDAVINHELRKFGYELPEGAVRLPDKKVEGKSWEEIYKEIKIERRGGDGYGDGEDTSDDSNGTGSSGQEGQGEGQQKGQQKSGSQYGKKWSGDDVVPSNEQQEAEGQELEQGDEELQNAKSEKEIEKIINKKLIEGATLQKMAGKEAGIWSEEIEAVLKPKVNWRRIFRREVQNWIANNVVSSWTRINRKIVEMPGLKKLGKPKVWWLVDTSGSMGVKELTQIFSELKAIITEVREIEVIEWDTIIQRRWKIKVKSELKRIQVEGRGGTEFAEVAKSLVKEIRPEDFIVITTDGYWYDEEEAVKQIKRWKSKSVIVATTAKEVQGLKNIRLEVD